MEVEAVLTDSSGLKRVASTGERKDAHHTYLVFCCMFHLNSIPE